MRITAFFLDETGAVTVDWTVLAAAIVGLGISTVAAVRTGVVSLGGDIDGSLSAASVASLGTLGDGVTNFTYTLLFASDALYTNWMASFSGWPDATLTQMYDIYAAGAAQYISDGNTTNAAYYTDLAYAMQQVLLDRGLSVSDGGAVLQDLHGQQS